MKRVKKDGKIEKKVVRNVGSKILKGKDHWVNEGVKTVDKIKCYIPVDIERVMRAINRNKPGLEYSIFCVMDYNDAECQLELDKAYFIPEQEVTAASVDYKEDAPAGYNTVIHKHPHGCRRFSGIDDTYINQNFAFSLLWENGKFVSGVVRVQTQYGNVHIPLDIEVEDELMPSIPTDQLAKISKRTYGYSGTYQGKYGGGLYGGGYGGWPYDDDDKDYLGRSKSSFYGHGKNNSSLGVSGKKNKKKHKHHSVSKVIDTVPHSVKPGEFLTREQEEVQNFIAAQKEELIEYLEEVRDIKEEYNVPWEEAEQIYRVVNQDTLNKSLLDFNDKNLGIPTGVEIAKTLSALGNIKKSEESKTEPSVAAKDTHVRDIVNKSLPTIPAEETPKEPKEVPKEEDKKEA